MMKAFASIIGFHPEILFFPTSSFFLVAFDSVRVHAKEFRA
jgi:hypothetical protein